MHIPDGFLSTPVWATLNLVTVPAVGYMARRATANFEESRVPLLGMLGAFVFAAQMINFPVGLGASGHLLGGALLACTIGPAAASIVMTAILTIQAFIFQDGGILALGANIMNLAVAGVLAGYLPFYFAGRGKLQYASVFAGGLLSVLVSGSLALGQIMLSGVNIQQSLAGLSLTLFLLCGICEGLITVAVLKAIERIHPEWIRRPERATPGTLLLVGGGALFLAVAGVLVASGAPDSLERVAAQMGIASREYVLMSTPLADYEWSGISSEWLRKALAGLAGLSIVYMLCVFVGRAFTRRGSV